MCAFGVARRTVRLAMLALWVVALTVGAGFAFGNGEVLKYEVTWQGNKAAHGDLVLKQRDGINTVVVQAVSDGYLKKIIEVWSRVNAKFTQDTFEPRWYQFVLKSNRMAEEVVDLKFDHATSLVRVDKQKGDEHDVHSEQFSRIYDPITAIYLLRSQSDLTKPMYVDIYDGKDRARLTVNPAGQEIVTVAAGRHPAYRLNLRLVKLTGSKEEIGTGNLWISNDSRRMPLLLKTSPIVGEVQLQLVQAQSG